MLQQEEPTDFVIATGRQKSVRTFIELFAKALGWCGIRWEGQGVDGIGRRADNNAIEVRIAPKYYRPAEVQTLLENPILAKEKLG
ncbi:GDP-mannose 4/6 dehydratase 2 domain protein [Synechococcus sp. ROS8604]|nr:GDP-mannose 4/6 dehydratase 2 domain protein [Synechococcus sp. ROS8604]